MIVLMYQHMTQFWPHSNIVILYRYKQDKRLTRKKGWIPRTKSSRPKQDANKCKL